MTVDMRGARPRPRVALLGEFAPDIVESLCGFLPTVWVAGNMPGLEKQTNDAELDLIIIAPGVQSVPDYVRTLHVINFSENLTWLPGPNGDTIVTAGGATQTEEYMLPPTGLACDRRRRVDFEGVDSARGWETFALSMGRNTSTAQDKRAAKLFSAGSLVIHPHSKRPLAFAFNREESNLGVAWLRTPPFSIVEWVRLLATEWSKCDPQAFPSFSDWSQDQRWLSQRERDIAARQLTLAAERKRAVAKYNDAQAELDAEYNDAQQEANEGIRRLVTSQGDELVHIVQRVFESMGFTVESIDETVADSAPKREDLRLTTPEHESWEAIVEVRGYKKSAGKTSDLQRLARFAEFYMQEKHRFPSKRIYVVNGELEVFPPQRQTPLAPAEEDLQIFAEQDGLLMWSLDVFQAMSSMDEIGDVALRKSVIESVGRWAIPREESNAVAEQASET